MIEEAKETSNSKSRNELLSFALCNSELLFSLINDILDFGQLKANKLKILLSETNLLEIVESVLQIMRIQTELKQIDLRVINLIEPGREILFTDSRRVKQILINLIGNAIKFTTTGYIQLTISTHTPTLYRFEIQDTGTGIHPEIIAKLCQPFQTFGNEKFKNSTGVGLGLCFCKQIVGLLGPFEELFIDSIYGKGAKFGFLIADQSQNLSPRKNTKMDLSILSQEEIHKDNSNYCEQQISIQDYFLPYSENKSVQDLDEFNLSIEKPHKLFPNYLEHKNESILTNNQDLKKVTEGETNTNTIKVNVLVVDDSLFNIIVLKSQLSKLKQFNFNIYQGYNGQMAVNIFKQQNSEVSERNIEIIFMDCNMPIMDGYKASEEIKDLIQNDNFVKTIIVALSAQILESNQACFDFVLNKPCPIRELSNFFTKIEHQIKG